MAYLFVLNGRDRCRAFALEGETLTIGKAPECDVRLHDPWVSWRHARLRREDGQWVLEDLGSTNGTYRNTEPLTRAVLADEDVLFFGRTHALFVLSDRPPSAPPSGRLPATRIDVSTLGPEELEWLYPETDEVLAPDAAAADEHPRTHPAPTARKTASASIADDADPTMRISDVLDAFDRRDEETEAEFASGGWSGESAGTTRPERTPPAPAPHSAGHDLPLDQSEALRLSSVPGGSWTGSVSTDSVYAPPRVHADANAETEPFAGDVIDVADLLEPAALDSPTRNTTRSDDDSDRLFADDIDLCPLVSSPPDAQPQPNARDEELLRLRRLLAQRDEEIRRLREELLRLKERYIDL